MFNRHGTNRPITPKHDTRGSKRSDDDGEPRGNGEEDVVRGGGAGEIGGHFGEGAREFPEQGERYIYVSRVMEVGAIKEGKEVNR